MIWSCLYWFVTLHTVNKTGKQYSGRDDRVFNETTVDLKQLIYYFEKQKLLFLLDSKTLSTYDKLEHLRASPFLNDLNPSIIKAGNLAKGLSNDFDVITNIL